MYLETYRPVLLGAGSSAALWLSARHVALTTASLGAIVQRRTKEQLGVALDPHMLRDAAFTSIAPDDPQQVAIGTVLLGHARIETGERHYNLARTDSAARKHDSTLRGLRAPIRTRVLLDAETRERARQRMLRFNRRRQKSM